MRPTRARTCVGPRRFAAGPRCLSVSLQNHVFAVAIRAIQEQAVDADPRVVIHGRSHAR